MSGADRRAEEQGYYKIESEESKPRTAPAPAVPLSVVCAEKGHAASATNGMKACACGERQYGSEEPAGLF